MQIRKLKPAPGNSLRKRGLIFQALKASAKACQEKTGEDYTTAWQKQVSMLARQQEVDVESEEELKKWIFSLPLGTVQLLHDENTARPVAEDVVQEISTPEEAFANLNAPPPWDELAAYLSVLAKVVYQPEIVVEQFILEQGGQSFCRFFDPITTSTGFGCLMYGHPVLCFRGTQTIRQWLIDGLVLPWGRPIRHMGFMVAWKAIKNQVCAWLDQCAGEKGLVLTGHSLGGAMAFLAAFDLSDRGIDAVITFGAPRPGMSGFRDRYGSRGIIGAGRKRPLAVATHRYTHETDLVSRVPPPILFSHLVGMERFVRNDGTIEIRHPPNYIQRIEAISTMTMALPDMLFGSTGIFSSMKGSRSIRQSLLVLLYTFWCALKFSLWGVFFLGCYLLALLIPLTFIDAMHHKMSGYVESFAKRFKFVSGTEKL